MKWNEAIPVEQNARQRLPRLLEKFYAAGREVIAHEDPETLHQFRLRGKRVRYTLELFRPLYGPGLEKLLKALRNAQTALGEINDCATARGLVPDPRFQSWIAERQARLRKEFHTYWAEEFDAPAKEQRCLRYLRTYARRKRSQPHITGSVATARG
jgi:CHAD domain-containing protein